MHLSQRGRTESGQERRQPHERPKSTPSRGRSFGRSRRQRSAMAVMLGGRLGVIVLAVGVLMTEMLTAGNVDSVNVTGFCMVLCPRGQQTVAGISFRPGGGEPLNAQTLLGDSDLPPATRVFIYDPDKAEKVCDVKREDGAWGTNVVIGIGQGFWYYAFNGPRTYAEICPWQR